MALFLLIPEFLLLTKISLLKSEVMMSCQKKTAFFFLMSATNQKAYVVTSVAQKN